MKPLILSMQAFGSYGKHTVIDFSKINQNLFLITGDTGAGKTTIFDAMVFALYGEASSNYNKKDGLELQSQFVDYNTKPFVSFTFIEGRGEYSKVYTVKRIPRHRRPLKRGEGVKEESETVSLIMPDGKEYPQKETNKKLLEIIGLTKNQFMQVVMIAQGEFMEVLRAKSDDKKIIFRKLFGTQLFQDIVEELRNRKKEKQQEIEQIQRMTYAEIGRVKIPENYIKKEELKIQRKRLLERFSIADMEEFLGGLEFLCKGLYKGVMQTEKIFQQLSQERDNKREAITNAKNILQYFQQYEQAKKDLEECHSNQVEIENSIKLIANIEKAYELQGIYQRYKDILYLVEDIQKKKKEQEEVLPQYSITYEIEKEKEKLAKIESDRELEKFAQISKTVQEEIDIFNEILCIEEKILTQKEILKQRQKTQKQIAEKLEEFNEKERIWKEEWEGLKEADKIFALWEVKKKEFEKLSNEISNIEKKQKEWIIQEKKVSQLQKEFQNITIQYENTNGIYERARKIFLNAQAGFLAKEQLREGEACPVCGSFDHPNPCVLEEEEQIFTKEKLESLGNEVRKYKQEQEKKALEVQSVKDIWIEKEKQWKMEMQILMNQIAIYMPQAMEVKEMVELKNLQKIWKEVLEEEGRQKKKNLEREKTLRIDLENLIQKRENLQIEWNQFVERVAFERAEIEKNQAMQSHLESKKIYPNIEIAKKELEFAKQEKESKSQNYLQIRERVQRVKSEQESIKALLEYYQKELPKQARELEIRKKIYKERIEKENVTEQEWKTFAQNYNKEMISPLQARVENHRAKLKSAQHIYAFANQNIKGQNPPIIEELQQSYEKVEMAFQSTQEKLEWYREYYRENEKVYKKLKPYLEERGQVMKKYQKLEDLYQLLAGKVKGSRMDIETFVQRYYLERILYSANRRFQKMSSGQFILQIYDIERAGEGKNRGLDLMVYSTITGKLREVRTLSGGESFMAALSLALGMADQIQERFSSIHLDVMFIDEGFGSLDDQARGQAVKVLREMAGGQKMIGMISHVTELKQEIENQLIVTKDEEGSHLKWKIS